MIGCILLQPQAPSYRGVDLARGKWRVRVYQGGRHHHIGVYSSAEEVTPQTACPSLDTGAGGDNGTGNM
eukprot:COSAG01_NODE_2507_length_7552_cov_56.408560_4_plen_69_part_00